MPVYEETEEDTVEIIVCPVKNCRQTATVEMIKDGVYMFDVCPRHAMLITEDDWHGWAVDYSVTGGILQVIKKFT